MNMSGGLNSRKAFSAEEKRGGHLSDQADTVFYSQEKFPSISRLLLLLMAAVFIVESCVESLLTYFTNCKLSTHIYLDSTITILLLIPLFYYLLYYPLRRMDLDRQRSNAEIQSLSRQLIRTSEQERHALARDLHDDFGQILTALQLGIETIKFSSEKGLQVPEEAGEKLKACLGQGEKLSGLVADLGDRVRAISSGLRPTMLDELGLPVTLEWLVSDFSRQYPGIQVSLKLDEQNERFNPEIELTIFRICQEALNNVAKHAHARAVAIELQQVNSHLHLRINDDGIGFGEAELSSARAGRRGTGKQGVGLLGMRERAGALQGSLEIKSLKGQGTEITVTLPTVWQERKGV